MDYSSALGYINTQEAVLFVGSFFSTGAINKVKEEAPSSEKLKNIFLKETNNSETDIDLKSVADFAFKKLGAKRFARILDSQFHIIRTTDVQRSIASQPWYGIYTTNYDNIIERITQKTPVTPFSHQKPNIALSDQIHHINGFVEDIGEEDGIRKIKLGNKSYLNENFILSPERQILINDLTYAKAVFFVGFSVKEDLDIARVISFAPFREKSFFINGETSSEIEMDRISKFGTFTGKTAEQFAEDLRSPIVAERKMSSPLDMELRLTSFRQIKDTKEYLEKKIEADDMEQLIEAGVYEDDFVLNPKYIVDRWRNVDLGELSNREAVIFSVRSDIANGKSIFMSGLAAFVSNSRNVFMYTGIQGSIYGDLRKIEERFERPLVFIDDASRIRNIYGNLSTFFTRGFQFVLSDRNSLQDKNIRNLLDRGTISRASVIDLVNLDQLSRPDFQKWHDIVQRFHLWGAHNDSDIYASYGFSSAKRKNGALPKASTFSGLLINIFNSAGVIKKFKDVIENYKDAGNSSNRLIVGILACNFLSIIDSLDPLKLMTLLDINNSYVLRENEMLSLFIDFQKMKFINKSSILARELLHDGAVISRQSIYDVLVLMMRNLDKMQRTDEVYALQRTLTSLSNLSILFGRGRRDIVTHSLIQDYYEKIQQLLFARNNVFIYVQLADSNIYVHKKGLSEKYLAYAEKLAEHVQLKDKSHLVNTRMNMYVEFAKDDLTNDPQEFLREIRWIKDLSPTYRDSDFMSTVLGKLHSPGNGFIKAVSSVDRDTQVKLYLDLFQIYRNLKKSYEAQDIDNPSLLVKLNKTVEAIKPYES